MGVIEILSTASDTVPFAADIAQAADTERNALGFFPASTYQESCELGRLFVAVECRTDASPIYVGHVMFGGASSELHIHQLYVAAKWRRVGVAKTLIHAVTKYAEERNYLGIAIRVAADLKASLQVWEKLGFSFVRTVRGRGARGRQIKLGHKELRTKSLLQFVQAIGQDNVSFSVPPNVGRGLPTYVIDLNVYFDCIKDRGRRPAAQKLFGAALSTLFRLLRTKEFTRELERHSPKNGVDPILELARAIPEESYDRTESDNELSIELSKRIFPDRATKGTLTARDLSDIDHLIVTIRSGATGFVTSERALLIQREWIRQRYGIDLVGVEEIVGVLSDAIETGQAKPKHATKNRVFDVFDLSERDTQAVTRLGIASSADPEMVRRLTAWARRAAGHRSMAVKTGAGLVAASGWRLVGGPPREVEAILAVIASEDTAAAAVDYLLDAMVNAASAPSPARIDLLTTNLPEALHRVLLDHGFTPGGAGNKWTKISVGRHVGPNQWAKIAHEVESLARLALPTALMRERFAYGRRLTCRMDDGRSWVGSLDDIEGLLSPIIMAFGDRPGTILPIRDAFAEDLFGHLRQEALFARPIASFRRERVYYSGSRSFRLFDRGSTLLFYESGQGNGRAAIVAAARSLGASTIAKADVLPATISRGVLDEREVERLSVRPTVTAVSFDNVLMLAKPVGINQLRANGWVPGHNFVTAAPIPGDVVRQILDLGYP